MSSIILSGWRLLSLTLPSDTGGYGRAQNRDFALRAPAISLMALAAVTEIAASEAVVHQHKWLIASYVVVGVFGGAAVK